MKDENNSEINETKLGVWNEPELEARLVAMLMGELSPYEEAEMKQELESSPELRAFRGRMEEVMGLISEVNAETSDDDEWTLSDARRGELLEKFGNKEDTRVDEIVSTAGFQWRSLFSVAACLLVSIGTFAMIFIRKGEVYRNKEEIVTYSAAGFEVEEEILMPELGKDAVYFSKSKGVDVFGDTSDVLQTMKQANRELYSDDPFGDAIEEKGIAKLEMTNEVFQKPSNPSSSMARVISSSQGFSTAVPVPSVEINEPSLDFGVGDDFGDGWGNGAGGGLVAELLHSEIRQPNTEELEFDWVADSQPKIAKRGSYLFDKAESNFTEQKGKSENERSRIVTGGNRSGDFAIRGNSIDAFLNNPNRTRFIAGGEGNLVQKETTRRSLAIGDADASVVNGRKAYNEKDYAGAVDQNRAALAKLPPGPIADERRDEYKRHLLDGSLALSQQYRRTGRYQEARGLIENFLEVDPGNVVAKKQLEFLDDPIRTSPTLTPGHVKDVEKVRKLLYRGQSYFDQAQFDHATLEFKEILRLDPYNKAARRGLDRVANAKSDYYRSAYDQTRASMLMQVDQAWEEPEARRVRKGMDSNLKSKLASLATRSKLESIELPLVEFDDDTTVKDAINFLQQRSRELDTNTLDSKKGGLKFDFNNTASSDIVEGLEEADSIENIKLGRLKIKNIPMDEALRQIAQVSGLRYKVEDGVVNLLKATDIDENEMHVRTFRVPDSLINTLRNDIDNQVALNDPFSDEITTLEKASLKDLLEMQGIKFPEGATVGV